MFYGELLVKKEIEEGQKKADRRREIREEIVRQQRQQKEIRAYMEELQAGIVEIAGRRYACEKKEALGGAACLYVFSEDIEQIRLEKTAASVIFHRLAAACCVQYLPMEISITQEKEYHDRLSQRLRDTGIFYEPVEEGSLLSGKRRICYACGVSANASGGVYAVNYYFPVERGFVTGSFSCKLCDRFVFAHLFLAMLRLMCMTEGEAIGTA